MLVLGTGALGAVGLAGVVWPLVMQMNPDASVQAVASTEVDLSTIAEGQTVTIKWRGKPVFIRHRTPEEIAAAKADDGKPMPDPEPDASRVRSFEKDAQEPWIVVLGNCTHLGCVPIKNSGEYNGWYCPCHGSHYDNAGRIRKGPAPLNLVIPPYTFVSASKVKIG